MPDQMQLEAFFKRYKLPEILARVRRLEEGWRLSSLPGTDLAGHRLDMYCFAGALQVLLRELYEEVHSVP